MLLDAQRWTTVFRPAGKIAYPSIDADAKGRFWSSLLLNDVERDILNMLAEGKSMTEIATEVKLSYKTIFGNLQSLTRPI